ncbi:MAG: hypothetical protein B0D92_02390 [Spirochaeta sp. LUC14_002_19_P3]|nr:MAG: hypothetical protein B0D92_02390 [Spirochaeta sp. LUC14_002_19_P3]
MKRREKTLFDEDFRLSELSNKGDYLEKLDQVIDWEVFRGPVEKAMRKNLREDGKGRPPNDAVLMFKTLILRELYQLSDDSMEYYILDRLSFQRFLGLNLCDDVPDAKSIWHYREQLTRNGVVEELFELFYQVLEEKGLIAEKGIIVDASFKEVSVQRNSKEENARIKNSEKIEEWSEDKRRQKDTDARWTKKNKRSYFGYKNHMKGTSKKPI